MEIKTLEQLDRTFNYTDQVLTVPRSATQQMLDWIEKWQHVYPSETTYVSREYGIPSLIVRFDGVLTADGTFDAYELQSGCGWVGYAGMVNPTFHEVLDGLLKKTWPPFALLAPPQKLDNPDELFWLRRIGIGEALASSQPLWLRYGEMQLHPDIRENIISRSLKPVRTHNLKLYGVELGWWKQVNSTPESSADLPWDESFALKPLQDFGSRDIMLWTPRERRGRSTRTQIEATLERRESMYLQRLIPPMRMDVGGAPYNAILRPFFGYDPQKKKWVPMHGVWTGRPYPNLRIHGASDAISGPLILET